MRYWRAFGASTLALVFSSALTAVSCSASNGASGSGFGGDGGGDSSNHPSGGIDGSGAGGSIGTSFPSGSGAGSGDGGMKGCATTKNVAKQKQLDMFIMLDQSESMSEMNKWTDVTGAIGSFVAQPGAAGIGVGLGYFPVPASGGNQCPATCGSGNPCGAGCGPCEFGQCLGSISGGNDSCTVGDYAKPVVEIATLPGANNVQVTTITQSMSGHTPDGDGTPTAPGLAGALQHCKAWAAAHPDDIVIAVLATDGDPNECNSTVAAVEQQAMLGLQAPNPIFTYVIGVGNLMSNLDSIAMAGGTTKAFIVTPGGNAGQEFLMDLNQIRGKSLSCSYSIPMPNGQKPDFTKLNIEYHPGGGGPVQTIPNVDNLAACPASGDAWYYDNNAAPTEIEMCPTTCTKLASDTMGEVDITLGCDTVKVPK